MLTLFVEESILTQQIQQDIQLLKSILSGIMVSIVRVIKVHHIICGLRILRKVVEPVM